MTEVICPADGGYPPCDPATVAPTTTKLGATYPDLFNHMPARQVTRAEAQARKWPYFYVAEECRYGHLAPRYASNPRMCIDCTRENARKPAIGSMAEGLPRQKRKKEPPISPGRPPGPPKSAVTPEEQKFLEAYATFKDFDRASEAVALSFPRARLDAQLSHSKKFAAAVTALEERLSIKRAPPAPGPYEWTEEKRARFLEAWTDTGDIATARDAIGVTPSEYLRELERNESFAAQVKKTEPLANRMLIERATQLALAGNDKLLNKFLPAIDPEKFSERMRLDVNQNTTVRLDDSQLDARLAKLLGKANAIDAQFIEVDSRRETRAIAAPRGKEPARESEQDSDDVSGQGSVAA